MRQFRPKTHLHAPKVWSPEGRELYPHVGGAIPKGSLTVINGEFITLPESIWILQDNGTDDMGFKLKPSYSFKSIEHA